MFADTSTDLKNKQQKITIKKPRQVSGVKCHMSGVKCHMLHDKCLVSPFTCRMSIKPTATATNPAPANSSAVHSRMLLLLDLESLRPNNFLFFCPAFLDHF